MGQVIQINGDYTIKARRAGGANVMFDTGEQIGSVTVTGDLHVLGTTHTFNSQVISDVVLVLNRGETGPGVTLRRSGIEIDRGSRDRADFLFDEDVNAWTVTHKLTDGTYSYADSNLQVRKILTDTSTDNGDLTLINTGTGVVKVAGTNAYETRVLDYTRLASVVITHIERSSSTHMITVTTATPHGLAINDYVDIHCATFPAFNAADKIILDRTDTTFKYADNGATFANTPVTGYVVKNSLMWIDGSSYVPTDDYIPNMRTVSDYSRSLVNAAIDNLVISHIDDQDTNVVVYDSIHGGTVSYVKADLGGTEKFRLDSDGIMTAVATSISFISGNSTVKEYIGPQTNSGYLFGSSSEIGLKSDTTSASVILSKDNSNEYLTLNAGTGNSEIDCWTTGVKRLSIDYTGKVFINTSTGSSQLNISSSNEFGGTGYAGLLTLTNTVAGALLPNKHVKISSAGDFEIANSANSASILKITDAGVATLINGLNVVDFIATPSSSFNLINTNATTVNFAGAGSTISIGASTGTTTIHNPTLAVGSGSSSSITTPATTFNLVNDTATTVNFAGAGSLVNIGHTTGVGLTNLWTDVVSIGTGTASTLTTPSTSVSVFDSVTDASIALAGSSINMGATTGQIAIRNPTLLLGYGATTTVKSPSTQVDLLNDTTTTVNFAGAGTSISIGASTGTTTIHNPTLAVGSGSTASITTPATTFNLVNDTATTVNFANAATAIGVGAGTGTTTVNHDLVVTGSLTVHGPSSSIGSSSLSVEDPIIYLGNNNPDDSFDLGFVGGYNFGPPGNQNPTHPHTGLVRDASDGGTWKLFSGITTEPTTTVDFTSAVYDKLKIGDLAAAKGVFSSDVSGVKGTFTGDVSGVKGTFTGDVSGVKGTFTGNLSTTGNLSAVGGAFSGTVTGITAAMVNAYSKSETYTQSAIDTKIADVAAGLAAGNVTVTISNSGGSTTSSVNLENAVTGILAIPNGGTGTGTSTGTGNVVLNNGPTLVSPILGDCSASSLNKIAIVAPAHDAQLSLADHSSFSTEGANELKLITADRTYATFPKGDITVGYLNIPQTIKTGDATSTADDAGTHTLHTGSGTGTYTIDNAIDYPIGTVLTVVNDTGAGVYTITISSGGTLVQAGTGTIGDRQLAADGIATIMKTTATKWLINGVGLS